jgi:two-component system, OmpR family, sensor histidine kinase BaeS
LRCHDGTLNDPDRRGAGADPQIAGWLAAAAAHDVANLLAVADSSALLIDKLAEDPVAVRRHAARVRDKLAAASRLMTRCLAIARGEPLAREPLELGALVRRAWDSAGSPEGVVLEASGLGPGDVLGEGMLLEAVLINLLRNSIDAGAQKVIVWSAMNETDLVVHVEDDGEGFAAEGSERPPRRNGIGLGASRRIIGLHAGELSIVSTPPGERGARIRLLLPRAPVLAGGVS